MLVCYEANNLLSKSGIDPLKGFSWDEATVEDILFRNSQTGLKKEDFMLPRSYLFKSYFMFHVLSFVLFFGFVAKLLIPSLL